MLILFIAIATSCHPTLFTQCRVLSLSFTEEGSSWLMKRLKKCSFLGRLYIVFRNRFLYGFMFVYIYICGRRI